MVEGKLLDVVFGSSTAFRLHSEDEEYSSMSVKIPTEYIDYTTSRELEKDQVSEPKGDQVPEPKYKNRIYHGVLETDPPTGPIDVAIKWVQGSVGVDSLRYEAAVYQDELGPLQGETVPKFYGFFTASLAGEKLACVILQWCEGSLAVMRDELNRRRMLAACRLHQAGIVHGNLRDGHFLLGQDGKVRIVDFSTAKLHKCLNEYPLLENDRGYRNSVRCLELYQMEYRISTSAKQWPTDDH